MEKGIALGCIKKVFNFQIVGTTVYPPPQVHPLPPVPCQG